MKIGNPSNKPALAPTTQPTVSNGHHTGKAAPTSAPTDPSTHVALSSTASTLGASESTAEFDSAKVDRISKAIADGSFKVNHEVIADKLIANAQELLGKVQR